MTTLYREKARCSVCGSEAEYTGIGSTNAFGPPDLDTRPPEMKRSTIVYWVQRCPECGYCASDVSRAPSQAATVVRSPEYTRQLSDLTFPELANRFLCKALIDESSGDYAAAAWALIHAAWACDDAEKPEQARTCRNKALDMIEKALGNGQEVAKQHGAATAIQVDLLRRTGRLTEARQLISTKRPTITDEIILKILDYQDVLLTKGDEGCHTIAEALRENE